MLATVVRVPAKINIVLAVGPRRADGFHDLATVFQAVSLYDEIEAVPGDGVQLTVEGRYTAGVPVDDSNLAVRAARTLAAHAGVAPGVQLTLRKNIPVAAGLAGGSADAAGVLRACNRLWGLNLPTAELQGIGASLGSDVPFAVIGETALGTGRGERLQALSVAARLHWVLAVSEDALSTPDVFRRLDELRQGRPVDPPSVPPHVFDALARSDHPTAVADGMWNDMQEAAISLRPALADVLRLGQELGALGGIVSGSGPTCVFLARDDEDAASLAADLDRSGICRAVHVAHGPATPEEAARP